MVWRLAGSVQHTRSYGIERLGVATAERSPAMHTREESMENSAEYIDIVFDGLPDAEGPRFIEIEDQNGVMYCGRCHRFIP